MEPNIDKVNEPYVGNGLEHESWRDMSVRLYDDVSNLFNREGQLIRTELNEKASQAKTAGINFAGGGAVLFVGLICLAATGIIVLSSVLDPRLAAGIVTLCFLVIGGIMIMVGKKKVEGRNLVPNRSIDAFGEIKDTLKEKMHEITKH